MAEVSKKKNKHRSWGWIPPYAAAALLVTLAFGAFLAVTIQGQVRAIEADPLCDHLLARDQAEYQIVTQICANDTTAAGIWLHNALTVTGQVVESYATPNDITDWDYVTAVGGLNNLCLLTGGGTVLQGPDLPAELDAATLQQLLGKTGSWPTEAWSYYSLATDLGTLVAWDATPQLDDYQWYSGGSETDNQGFTFVVGPDGAVTHWPNENQCGRPLTELSDHAAALLAGERGLYRLANRWYYCCAAPLGNQGEQGPTLVAAVSMQVLWRSFLWRAQIPLVLFAAAAIAILLYAVIMRRSAVAQGNSEQNSPPPKRKILSFAQGQFPRVLAVALAGTLLLSGAGWLVFALSGYAQQNVTAVANLKKFEDSASYYVSPAEIDYNYFQTTVSEAAVELVNGMNASPALCTPTKLAELAAALTVDTITWANGNEFYVTVEDIRVFDKSGNTLMAASDPTGETQSRMSAICQEQITQNPDGVLFYAGYGDSYLYMTKDSISGGTIMLEVSAPYRYESWCPQPTEGDSTVSAAERTRVVSASATADMGPGAELFCVEQIAKPGEPEEIGLMSVSTINSGTASDTSALTDFSAAALRDNYAGVQTILGERYYINVSLYRFQDEAEAQAYQAAHTSYWLVRAIPAAEVGREVGGLVPRIALAGGGLLLLLAALCCVRHPGFAPAAQNAFTARANRRTRTYNGHRVNGPIMGWGTASDWNHKTSEEQFLTALGNLAIITIGVLVLGTLSNGAWQSDAVLGYILNGTWERKLNIFACTYVVLVVVFCFSISWLARRLLGFITRNLGPRSETMGALFNSVLQYAAYLIALIYLLYYFGVNMSVLLASAGLLTLVLSPTLNALLGDVSAGMSLVMEDEYRVGDIVTINGYSGVVLELSLRTTRLEDLCGNVKMFNNSKITEVENLTLEYSLIPLLISVPYEESLDDIEKMLENELAKLPAKIPALMDAPTYAGVKEFAASGVVLQIFFLCREEDHYPTLRRMNHEMKCIFDRRGISIPYDQLVLHQAEEESSDKGKKQETEQEAEQETEQEQ